MAKSEDELLEQVKSWRASGYEGFKVKIGKPDVNEDVERLTKVRELIGAAPLMVDANQGWGPELAPRRINALRRLDLTWVEEPLISDDISGHARLRTQIETPIGVGENIYTIYQWRDYLVSGAVDFVQADVVRVGGITPYLEIAALAQAFNRPMAPHFMLELSSQVLCALPNGYIGEDVEGGSLSALKALRTPHKVVDGYYTPPEMPGHGFDLDREYMARTPHPDGVRSVSDDDALRGVIPPICTPLDEYGDVDGARLERLVTSTLYGWGPRHFRPRLDRRGHLSRRRRQDQNACSMWLSGRLQVLCRCWRALVDAPPTESSTR